MFIATGLGPYSGQAVHFKHFAPKDLDYAHNRYQFEAHRHYKILDDHLAKSRYMVGDTYTIVDMAFWGWARMAPFVLGDDAFAQISRTSNGWSTRSRRGRPRPGDRAEGQVHLQDRDGRRGAPHHVRPSEDQGGLIGSAGVILGRALARTRKSPATISSSGSAAMRRPGMTADGV